MSKMTVDEALDLTARLVKESVDTDTVTHLDRVLITLHTEVRRLRAGVEKLGDKDRTFHIAYGNDRWVKVSDVLRILEGDQ